MNVSTILDRIDADATLAALATEVKPRMGDDPAHDWHHSLRVAGWTLECGGDALDFREVVAAALLHDIVNVPKNSPQRSQASALSADEARRLLPRFDFSSEAIERVAGAILSHSYSAGHAPTSLLGRALQDADRLEAIGSIGIFRWIATGARMGSRYFDADDPWAERRPLDDRQFSVDHCFTKLLKLEASFQTERGRLEARRRSERIRRFLADLGEELGQPMPETR